jgi:hypothetical protein
MPQLHRGWTRILFPREPGGQAFRLDRTTGNPRRGAELSDLAAGQFRIVRADVTKQPVIEEPDAERETLLIDVGG